MIDHVSIGVKDINKSERFYTEAFSTIGYVKLIDEENTTGYGKKYPEFWLNSRPTLNTGDSNHGTHIGLRVRSVECVQAFYKTALQLGALSDGGPGIRKEYADNYYAAFIVDFDGNKIEVVTFLDDGDSV